MRCRGACADSGCAACEESHPVSPELGIDPFEQVNFKVPRGTKLRVKRLALDQGGITMMELFMQMLDDYERRRRSERGTG